MLADIAFINILLILKYYSFSKQIAAVRFFYFKNVLISKDFEIYVFAKLITLQKIYGLNNKIY